MNTSSIPNQKSSCYQRPNEFLPLQRLGSETRRQSRNPTWWNNPNFAHESFEDPFKAEKESKDLKANATTIAPALFIAEDDVPNPAEEALSIDISPSNTQCEQAPKKLTSGPAEIQIASVTDADETGEQEESKAVGKTSRPVQRAATESPTGSCGWHVLTKRKILTNTSTPIILMRPDDFLPLGSPPSSPKRKSWQAVKKTAVVDTDEYHAETKEEVEQTVGRSVDTDIDDSATPSSPSSHATWVARSVALRRTPPASPNRKSYQSAKNTAVVDTDEYHAETKEKVEKTVGRSVDTDDSATPSSPSSPSSHASWVARSVALRRTPPASPNATTSHTNWVALAGPVRTTYQARVAKKTAVDSKGDGVNKGAQPEDVLKNKGVTLTEKNIEWEKPDWTKSRELKATGKADVLWNEGNLARPISVPVGSNNDTGFETGSNIAWEKPDKTTDKGGTRGALRN
jgi:hypothetical protein